MTMRWWMRSLLGITNLICKVYVTIIRGTPMMVQLLIMGLVIFASDVYKRQDDPWPVGEDGEKHHAKVAKGKQVNMLPYRRKSQIIFQDPSASLDPRMTVGEIIGEALDIHKLFASCFQITEKRI